jgi:sulfite exporter TauE/SafE
MGLGLHIWGIQQWVSLLVGTVMIFSVGFPVIFKPRRTVPWYDRLLSQIRKMFSKYFGVRTYLSAWMIGLLNGLLPCGLVYIALAGALLTSTPVNGAIYMVIFGLGTIPALLGLSLLGNVFGNALRSRIQGVIPFLVLFIGVLFVLRGMNLGIPYVSPKMDPVVKQKTEEFQKPECCH